MVTCPECGREMQRKGLFGHLRLVHGITGDKLKKSYKKTVVEGEVVQQERDLVNEAKKLHAEVMDLGARLKDAQARGRTKLVRLYEFELERAQEQLDEFMLQATLDGDDETVQAVDEAEEAAKEAKREAESEEGPEAKEAERPRGVKVKKAQRPRLF